MIIEEDAHDELIHYGTPRHSGRYPWGTHGWGGGGNTQDPRNMTFMDFVDHVMKDGGLTQKEVADGFGITIAQLRAKKSVEISAKKQADIGQVQRLKDKGNSIAAISRRTGLPDSTVRSYLKPGASDRANILNKTSDMLKSRVDSEKIVDIGSGVEAQLGISSTKLSASVKILEEKGYAVHTVKVPLFGTKHETSNKVLTPPGTTWADANRMKYDIKPATSFSGDGGRSYAKIHNPIAISPSRVAIKYKEDGGGQADGLLYVRPGVSDVSIGENRYAQVRVQVGPHHFLKGMAMYNDNLPKGTDIVFHTNKKNTGNKVDALKKLSDDPGLPFESIVRQIIAHPGTKDEHVTSAMNIVAYSPNASKGNEEGGLTTWSNALSAQFLSKQSPVLAKTQLAKTYDRNQKKLEEIKALTNPTIKKKLLNTFADSANSAAVDLEAAALSTRQAWHFILPLNSLKPHEVYAPRFNNGERVALVRYPHGGTFEIPELTVNNKHPEGRKLLGDVPDAVGIHHSVAQRLSGADFDGDTVIVIPNNNKKVKHTAALEALKGFDPQAAYPHYPGMVNIGARKQPLMGDISNLITDMTIRGAAPSEIARAIKHSMVIIDAEKHNLNYKQSYIDNGIAQLKREYQGGASRGASTLISRAGSQEHVLQRTARSSKEGGPVDLATGRKVFTPTNRNYRSGKPIRERSKKLAEVYTRGGSAHELVSAARTPMERLYADHADSLNALGNSARLQALKTPSLKYSPSANKVYAGEVKSLKSKLSLAIQNRPLERQASVIAGATVKAKRQANPNLDGNTLKKVQYTELENARRRLGANKKQSQVQITPNEWNAIQSGAISNHMLEQILTNTDMEQLRKYATPHHVHVLTSSKSNRAKAMLSSGYTRAEVAKFFGVSLTTLDTATKTGASS